MRIKTISSLVAAAGLLLTLGTAHAQDSTTGAVRGVVKDRADGTNVVGATVIATGAALQGQQAHVTSEGGSYYIANLPPGIYEVSVYYGQSQFSRKNVLVRLGKVSKVNITIDSSVGSEVIEIEGRAPIVDQDSTKTGTTITKDYTENIPTGRTFGAVLGAAAGSQGDLYGVSFSGSTSVENTYIVEGLNTTDPGFGLLSTNLPNEFVRETEVITGGYEAEYGRSTGGIVNVITKSGSNEFHGSVFGYWTPGALVGSEDATPRAGSAIDRRNELSNSFDFGAEVGGPIIKDKLWFHVGINPSFQSTDVDRIVQRQEDADQDGIPDSDQNGFSTFEELGRTTDSSSLQRYYYTAKLTGAVNPDNQGSLSLLGSQTNSDNILTVTGVPSAGALDVGQTIVDTSIKWTSKFNNNQSQVDVVLGYHYDKRNETPGFEAGGERQIRYETRRPLTDFAMFEDGGQVDPRCEDAADPMNPGNDDYPLITNCPVPFYRLGGLGFLEDTTATRAVAALSFTQRIQNLAGQHRIKVGADVEFQGYDSARQYTGTGWHRERASGIWTVRKLFTPTEKGVSDLPVDPVTGEPMLGAGEAFCGAPEIDFNADGNPDAVCRQVTGQDTNGDGVFDARDNNDLAVETRTRNIGAYIQDSWSILPNLTVNAGLRWESQTLFTADGVAGTFSPSTGEAIPDEAFALNNMFAPRLGVIYDWTQEGRSKVYGHWGRFYESIPMDINVRAYGGEILNINVLLPCDTTAGLNNPNCNEVDDSLANLFFGGGEEMVTPGLDAQFLDEIVLGTEYEVLPDLKVGASYIRRELGRVIEDVSTDGANTYIIANPGDVDQGAVDALRAEADALEATDPGRAAFKRFQADQFEGVGIFDAPERVYNGIRITADKRFTRNFFVTASYTYSKLRGNFPGLFSPETGQLDPNLTSMYDLPELMANRYGDLAADRPHLLKIDGFYRLIAEDIGAFTFGARIRGSSGSPHNVLGSHSLYGLGESYILPRGEEITYMASDGTLRTHGRDPFTTRFDTHIAYARKLSKGMTIEAFVDIFNLFNQQPKLDTDEIYTFDDTNPIVGGDSEDLRHAKTLDGNGVATANTVTVNPNFGNVNARQAPVSARFGIRLTF